MKPLVKAILIDLLETKHKRKRFKYLKIYSLLIQYIYASLKYVSINSPRWKMEGTAGDVGQPARNRCKNTRSVELAIDTTLNPIIFSPPKNRQSIGRKLFC